MLALAGAGVGFGASFPTPLPDPQIPGFAFPESEATLTRWITDLNRGSPAASATAFERVHQHAWGLWAALTQETAQSVDGQRLRVFETWTTTDELADLPTGSSPTSLLAPSRRTPLRPLSQLMLRVDRSDAVAHDSAASAAAASTRVVGFVKYDPTAADHIVRQQLLHREALDALLEGGAQQIPPFPATALAVKPLFQIARVQDLVEGRYYALKTWRGPPATPRVWGPSQWLSVVWIDVLGGGSGRGDVDDIPVPDGSTRQDATTYPLSALIHYRLSTADAAALNEENPTTNASAGDLALLVAMHVSGRETARWTWQTFWWTPAPGEPPAPSGSAIASLRPAQLTGAARNYAMTLAYSMLSPDQPYVGGANRAPAVYAYNPWLEARLAPADLPDSIPGFAPNGQPAANSYGVQSNCMSCHAQANYNPHQRETAPRPAGARYVDLGAAEFVGTLQVDFLWSLARHAR
jgi:hypothetical protein